MQGTSKSSRYTVLVDDLKLTADQLQRLCFYACHNCVRTRRPVSIPTPLRYAGFCALRSMQHIQAATFVEADFVGGGDTLTTTSSSRKEVKMEKLAKCIEYSKVSSKKLYYV